MNIANFPHSDELRIYVLGNSLTIVVADANDSWYSRFWLLLP